MAGLFDFLKDPEARKQIIQGLTDSANRGMIAATLGAPVDAMGNVINLGIAGAGYLGHKAGLIDQPPPMIDMSQAVGSSEWIGQQMQNAGIVSENRNPIAEAGFSMLTPVAGRVPGAIAAGARKAAQNAAVPSDMAMQGQRGAVYIGKKKISNNAFHGTDRQFDRFSEEEIGSSNANLGDAFWLTDDYGHARGYAQQASGSKTGNIVKEANVFLKKPMIVDAMESANKLADDIGGPRPEDWPDAADLLGYTDWVRELITDAKNAGHDGLIIKNTGDAPGTAGGLSDHYAIFKSNRIRFK